VRQQVIATLGRLDELAASGRLERLLRSGARFAAQALVLEAARAEPSLAVSVHRVGPGLVFERLWDETGCRAVIANWRKSAGTGSTSPISTRSPRPK
jgi:hypothetical protein